MILKMLRWRGRGEFDGYCEKTLFTVQGALM
jgi:hypothetical protein